LLVGKEVQFHVAYTVSAISPPRENGIVFLPGMNVLENVISEGWVKLREARKDKSEEEETLLAKFKGFEETAKAAGKGIWSSESGKIDVKHDLYGKEKEFLENWKGKDIDGIKFSVSFGLLISSDYRGYSCWRSIKSPSSPFRNIPTNNPHRSRRRPLSSSLEEEHRRVLRSIRPGRRIRRRSTLVRRR
jgi:hypothetical protein